MYMEACDQPSNMDMAEWQLKGLCRGEMCRLESNGTGCARWNPEAAAIGGSCWSAAFWRWRNLNTFWLSE